MSRATLATMYGVGLAPHAPGTCGSLVAALLAYGILQFPLGYLWLALGVLVFTRLGMVTSSRYMRAQSSTHDPKEIVIDELVGQWLTYSIWHGAVFFMAANAAAGQQLLDEIAASPLYLALGFVLFRFFDIIKPWPISLADRRAKGGFGVMLDDILAAIPAGILLCVCYIFSPLVMGSMEVSP